MKALYQKIRSLQGKNYGLYKSLADRSWDFGDFVLEFLHVQGDPYAPASRVMIKASLLMLGFPSEWGGTFERRLALSDYLYRRLSALVREKYPDRDAAVVFDTAGPEMLVRNALWVDNGELRACLQVRLPGDGRKIQAEAAGAGTCRALSRACRAQGNLVAARRTWTLCVCAGWRRAPACIGFE